MNSRSRWLPQSVRSRILLWSALLLVAALSVAVAVFAVALDRITLSAAESVAVGRTTEMASAVADPGTTAKDAVNDTPAQGTLLQLIDAKNNVVVANDAAAGRTPLTGLRPRVGQTLTQEVSSAARSDDSYAVAARGVEDPTGTYVLVAATPLREETRTVQLATALLAGTAGLLFLGLMVMIWRVVTIALQPVENIRLDVSRIRQVRSGGRVSVPPSEDEIARLANTMNDMLARLEQADAASRRFVSDASHELRSPIATIRAAVETDPTTDHVGETDKVIQEETTRLQELVDDLLTLAKDDDNGLTLASHDVDVDDLAEAEVRRLRALGIVDVEARLEPARITGDTRRLEQVLRNLTDNAVRHARSTVRITVTTEASTVTVDIENDGPPVPESAREAVFDRFTRLDDARIRDSGGSGLGLAICRSLVGRHGGSISTDETSDGWCRFRVRLPTVD